MEVLYPRCAGLDVHKDMVVGCMRVVEAGRVTTAVQTFGTTTAGLLTLADWLEAHGCTHVALESTGVYWKPVWHVLAGDFERVLAHAGHVRNVPGRKSDVNDAVWLADLLAHGLLRGSFVPPPAVQELRDLTRTRKQLVRTLGQHVQRIEKVLEDANIKLTDALTDVVGASGRRILEALIAGESDPTVLAALASARVKASRAELAEALRGRVTPHHRFLLREHLAVIDHLRERIAVFEAQIGATLEPFRLAAERLMGIPGVSHVSAHVIVAEIGRHAALPVRPPPDLVGGALPPHGGDCRQAPLHPHPQGGPLAQDGARAMCLGGQPRQGDISAGAVPPAEGPPRCHEGSRRGGGPHPDRRVLHAARWRCLPGTWAGLLRPARQSQARAAPGTPHQGFGV
jgi:transposase